MSRRSTARWVSSTRPAHVWPPSLSTACGARPTAARATTPPTARNPHSATNRRPLPGNLRGALPPAGRENLLVAEDQLAYAFDVWKFHVDYSGSGSTFTGPVRVSQTPYTVAASAVPTPGNALDTLRERL